MPAAAPLPVGAPELQTGTEIFDDLMRQAGRIGTSATSEFTELVARGRLSDFDRFLQGTFTPGAAAEIEMTARNTARTALAFGGAALDALLLAVWPMNSGPPGTGEIQLTEDELTELVLADYIRDFNIQVPLPPEEPIDEVEVTGDRLHIPELFGSPQSRPGDADSSPGGGAQPGAGTSDLPDIVGGGEPWASNWPAPDLSPAPQPEPQPEPTPAPDPEPLPSDEPEPSPEPSPEPEPETRPAPVTLPRLDLQPDSAPTLSPFAAPGRPPPGKPTKTCECEKPKKKKKEPKEREKCYRGTYREFKRGTAKHQLEEVPCEKKVAAKRPQKTKPKIPDTLGGLAKDVFGY